MKKYLLILLILSLSLFGSTTVSKLKFESGITIYGQVGFVDLVLIEDLDNNTYEMKATTRSTGLVKVLTSNRRDIFTSKGKIEDGVYKPLTFTKEALEDDYRRVISYFFNYEDDKVEKVTFLKKYKYINTFDPATFKFVKTKKLVEKNEKAFIKLYPNDFLSLYLNMKKGKLQKGKVSYVDKKDKDSLFYRNTNLIEVHKKHGEDKYKIVVHHDEDSLFFKKVESVGISFYGDAYIEKVSETKEIVDSSRLVLLDQKNQL